MVCFWLCEFASISVMSSGFFASHATAALHVMVLPVVDLKSARRAEKSGEVSGTQNWLDMAIALRGEKGIEVRLSNRRRFGARAAVKVESALVFLIVARRWRGERDMGKEEQNDCALAKNFKNYGPYLTANKSYVHTPKTLPRIS